MKTKSINFSVLLLVPLLLVFSGAKYAQAEVLFEDNFDARADLSIPYTSSDQGCSVETSCNNVPAGYYGYYISKSTIETNGNGLHINSTNKRGDTGKGLTLWDYTDGLWDWSSDVQLAIEVPAQKELYVRYFIKMQPSYSYLRGGIHSILRKLNHISHYKYNGQPFTFFSQGGFFPTTINQIEGGYANLANIKNDFFIRTDPSYVTYQPPLNITKGFQSGTNSVGLFNFFDSPTDSLPIGNESGTGTEFNSPGIFGDSDWHCLEYYVKNNSAPGVADGAYKFWMDGNIQADATGFIFREGISVLPENIWNFVHIGGNAYNPFMGEGNSGWQWYAVDDLVISNTYVGPDYAIGGIDTSSPSSPTGLSVQ